MTSNGEVATENLMRLARGLGWFSIGLGVAEMLAPRRVARLAGIPERGLLLRLFGLREVASGLGIFAQRRPTTALWSRVVGDVLDISLLVSALASSRSSKAKVAAALAAVGGVTALDVYSSRQVSRKPEAKQGDQKVEESVTINGSPEELYAFWRKFENLPRFMEHLESVEQTGPNRWHWVAKGPAGMSVAWDAEIINERPGELIAWRSVEGSDVTNAGTVRFERAPGGRGTVVRVKLEYHPPAGALGATVAKLLAQAPEKQVPMDLRRFKQIMEVGEVVRTEGQPAGRPTSTSPKYDELIRR